MTTQDADEVFPIHYLCHAASVQDSIISYTFKYDIILDADVLKDGLTRLLTLNGWRKFGGRLRRNTGNKCLELHVPRSFTAARPPVKFVHHTEKCLLSAHPIGAQIPQANEEYPSIHVGMDDLEGFSIAPGASKKFQTYLNTDEPVLNVYVITFDDATLISVVHPHAIADGQGTRALLHAWTQLMADRQHKIPPLLGVHDDVLDTVGHKGDVEADAPHVLSQLQLSGLAFFWFVLGMIWDLLWTPKMEKHIVHLPAKFISDLRSQAVQGPVAESLQEESPNYKGSTPFVSDNDIIAAWFAQWAFRSRSTTRSGVILNIFDIRSRLRGVCDPTASYVQNLILPIYCYLSPGLPSRLSLGDTARALRKATSQQTEASQVRRLIRATRLSHKDMNSPPTTPLFGTSDSMLFICTSWERAKFFEAMDMSAAVLSMSASKSTSPVLLGRCAAYWGSLIGTNDAYRLRDQIIVYGKDRTGGMMLHASLRPATWKLIRAELNTLSSTK